jgi:hypothetical protein
LRTTKRDQARSRPGALFSEPLSLRDDARRANPVAADDRGAADTLASGAEFSTSCENVPTENSVFLQKVPEFFGAVAKIVNGSLIEVARMNHPDAASADDYIGTALSDTL